MLIIILNYFWQRDHGIQTETIHMPIYDHTQLPHPSGFRGFRVTRYFADEKKNRQQWLGIKNQSVESVLKAAEKLLAEWEFEALGFDIAWFEAVSFLAKVKNIKQFNHLVEKKPAVEQFRLIASWQNSQGYEIPEH